MVSVMDDARRPMALATAALQQIISNGAAYQAAVIRGDTDEANRLRSEGHDHLDAYFDRNGDAATAVRTLSDL